MTYVVFENPGEFDYRLLKTFGVNVKPNTDSPIGYFGTGLKYAAAIIVRLGGSFIIQDGRGNVDHLHVSNDVVRGKTFPFVMIDGTSHDNELLPFTTELGKNWVCWHAYRELYSNAIDEQGRHYTTGVLPEPAKGVIRFIVKLDEMFKVFLNHDEYFLDRNKYALIGADEYVEVYDKSGHAMYLNGIMVHWNQLHCKYAYNFIKGITLSEDRGSSYEFQRSDIIRCFWAQHCEDEHALKQVFMSSDVFEEGQTSFSNLYLSDKALQVAEECMAKKFTSVNSSLVKNVHARRSDQAKFNEYPLTAVQDKMFIRAKKVLTDFGYDMTLYPIISVKTLGHAMGMADDGKIYITQLAFDKGMKQVVATLLEEWIHLEHMVSDCTREMQDILFDKIVNMMEEKLGEPL